MNRRAVYFAVLKFKFQHAIVNGASDLRAAYRSAKNDAAAYSFLAPTENLRVWVPVW